jgi:sugar lactone lactonase YvrE
VVGEVRVFRATGAVLGESPFWQDGALHWTDIERGEVHISPASGAEDGSDDRVLTFPPPVPALQPAGDGFVVALRDRVIIADRDGTEVHELARLDLPDGMRLNEGKVDPQGRFLIGAMNAATGEGDAAWYRVGGDGAQVHHGGFSVTNALEWSLDERTVYLGDTGVKTIYRAPWHPDAGPGELTRFSSGDAVDGMAIDRDGCFWTAVNGEGFVLRLDPSGEPIERVQLPVPNVTGVGFGGEDLDTLFVCSAREKMTDQQLEEFPLSGGIFALDTTTRGLPVRSFAP